MSALISRRRVSSGVVVVYCLLVIACVLYLAPIYLQVVTGFKSFREVNLATMWKFPTSFGLGSFIKAWIGSESQGMNGLAPNFMNSVYITVPATVISAFLGSMNGYVLAKWRFKGANVLFPLLLFGMFIPYQSILIPLVQVLQRIGLYGTRGGLVFVHVVYGIPITTLIFRNYYAAIPDELVEASKIDGAGILGIYANILFPLSVPGFVVVIIWQFTSIWNDFLFGLIVTSSPSLQPITVALNNLAGSYFVEWNVQMAGALLAALPTMIIYIFLSRYFMSGLLAGSVKG
ncbi:MAG: carbohydrate ABC transporter permease [Spirochaetia bacterium]|jgi:glucose/mannose transport system permease protein